MTEKARTLPRGFTLEPIEALLKERSTLEQGIADVEALIVSLDREISGLEESGAYDDKAAVDALNSKRSQREMCPHRIRKLEKRISEIEPDLAEKLDEAVTVVATLVRREVDATVAAAAKAIRPFMFTPGDAERIARQVNKISVIANTNWQAEHLDSAEKRAQCIATALRNYLDTGSLIEWPCRNPAPEPA